MLEKVIRKQTLEKILQEQCVEFTRLVKVKKDWYGKVKSTHKKTKRKKTLSCGEKVEGIIGCLVVMKLNEEIPALRQRIKRVKKLIKQKNEKRRKAVLRNKRG